jgi:PucR C-terminal helix-turn-helix domain/GGDEF-like domain
MRAVAPPPRWAELLEATLADRDRIVATMTSEIVRTLPSYRRVPAEQLAAAFAFELERVLQAARAHGEDVADDELAGLAAIGEARARQRVPAGDMLLAWRIGVQVVLSHSRQVAERLGVAPAEMLEFVQSLLAWSDRAMAITAVAHRRAELDVTITELEERRQVVRGALLGTLAPEDLRVRAERSGLDVTRQYVAISCRLPEDGTTTSLERRLGFHDAVRPRHGLSAVLEGSFVGLLREPPTADADITVGVGPPRPLSRLNESFTLASRAARTATAYGLGGVRSFDSLGALPAVMDDTQTGDALARRYLDPLGSSGPEILQTVRAYFDHQANVEQAADALHVHPNTVRYRLKRLEELSGARLRDPLTALEVWWAVQRQSQVEDR